MPHDLLALLRRQRPFPGDKPHRRPPTPLRLKCEHWLLRRLRLGRTVTTVISSTLCAVGWKKRLLDGIGLSCILLGSCYVNLVALINLCWDWWSVAVEDARCRALSGKTIWNVFENSISISRLRLQSLSRTIVLCKTSKILLLCVMFFKQIMLQCSSTDKRYSSLKHMNHIQIMLLDDARRVTPSTATRHWTCPSMNSWKLQALSWMDEC